MHRWNQWWRVSMNHSIPIPDISNSNYSFFAHMRSLMEYVSMVLDKPWDSLGSRVLCCRKKKRYQKPLTLSCCVQGIVLWCFWWLASLYVAWRSTLVSVAVVKYSLNANWRKWLIWLLDYIVPHWGKPRQKLGSRDWSRNHGGMLLTELLPWLSQLPFIYSPGSSD